MREIDFWRRSHIPGRRAHSLDRVPRDPQSPQLDRVKIDEVRFRANFRESVVADENRPSHNIPQYWKKACTLRLNGQKRR